MLIQKSIINIKNFYISGEQDITHYGKEFYCPIGGNSGNYQNFCSIQIWLLLTLTQIFYLLFK
jgi:hypothetical protein